MKKTIFLSLFLMVISFAGIAQSFNQTASNSTGAILNASLDTMNFSTVQSYTSVGIQPVITKATGTMAGTAVLYGSINGTNFVAAGDTLTFTNVTTNTTVWTKTNPVFTYWRIITSGATTVTGTAAARFKGVNTNR